MTHLSAPSTAGTLGRVCVIGTVDEAIRQVAQVLSEQRYLVAHAPDIGALDDQVGVPPDLVLIDTRPQPSATLPLLAALQARLDPPATAVVLLLPEVPSVELLDLIADTNADYLVAPTSDAELIACVALQLRRRARRRHAHRGHVRLAQEHAAQQRALGEQQARGAVLGSVFDRLPVGAMIVSAANQIEQVNEAMCRFLGYEAGEMIGRQAGFMVLPEDYTATVAAGHQLAAGTLDRLVHERRRYVRKDGTVALGKLTVFALRHADRQLRGFLSFTEDIGARAEVEDELARYTRYQQALANASLTLMTVAPDAEARGRVLTQALQQLVDGVYTSRASLFRNVELPETGLALQLVAEAWSAGQRSLSKSKGATRYPVVPYAALPAAHRERLLAPLPVGGLVEELYAESPELLATIQAEGIRSTQTIPVIEGGAHWGLLAFDEYTHPRGWDHTSLVLLSSAATMVGQALQRWRIEDDLRVATQVLRATGHLARVGGWSIDLERRIAKVSEELAAILELEPGSEVDVEQLLAFFSPEAQSAIQTAAGVASHDGGGWELEQPMVTASGRHIWVNMQGQAEQRDGQAVRLHGAIQDVSRRKAAELRLERQLRIEAALTRCSRELLATVVSEGDLSYVASRALEQLRSALEIDQAFLMRLVHDLDEPYLTMAALSTVPVEGPTLDHPLAQRFPLALIPPHHLQMLEAGKAVPGPPGRSEALTPEQHAWLDSDRARTRIALPVRIDGTLWGILGFNGLAEREWGEAEQAVLGTAAEMFGHVIRRLAVMSKLQRSEEQFRTAVETMLDGFAIFDSVRDEHGAIVDFRYRYINEVGCRLNQRSREEQLGRTLLALLPAHRDSELFADYVRLVETGLPVARESLIYEDQYGSGQRLARVFDVRAARLGDGFAVIWRDVTDRRLAHQSLTRANDDLLRRVNELRTLNLVAQTLAFTRDLRASLETVCAAVAERTGAAAAGVVGFSRHRGEAESATLPPELDQLAGMRVLTPDELGALGDALLRQRRPIALTRSGPDFPLGEGALRRLQCEQAAHLLLVPLAAPTGNLGLLVLQREPNRRPFSADHQSLAETVAGQIATAVANAQLGEQARRAAALAERNRVARDLHDSATQSLYSLVLIAGGWAMKAEKGRLSDIPAKFTQLSEIAVQVLKELRLLIYQLRHPELEAAGLLRALEERLAAVEQRANVRTSFEVVGDLVGLAPDVEEQLYAMLQEALNNALRHGRASSVSVTIRAQAGEAVFTVRDDGVGFDPEQPSSGLGLRSMHERATALGARLTLSSQLGQGTVVEIRAPLTTTGGEPLV